MPIRGQVCAWIASFGLVASTAASAQDRSEREVIECIVRDGPQARAIRDGVEVSRREHLARLSYPNPQVMYSREGAGFTEFLQVEQSLPAFGTRAALMRAGVAATQAAEAERDARLWTLRADAAAAVVRLMAGQSRHDVAGGYRDALARLIEILRVREREGEGSRFDRLRAEQELREAAQLLTSASIAVLDARTAVSTFLPRDVRLDRVEGLLDVPPLTLTLDDLFARAAVARADVRAMRLSADRAELEADAARRQRLPSPTAFGGLKRGEDAAGRTTGGVFGVSASLPLFDRGNREADRWRAERGRVEAERAALEHQIQLEIIRASEALSVHRASLAGEPSSSADELAAVAEIAYREGELGIIELLDAYRTTFRARLRRLEIQLDARLSQIALERAVGETLWP